MTRQPLQPALDELLDQGEVWYARGGPDGELEPTLVAEMTREHCINLRRWLLAHASRIQFSIGLETLRFGSFFSSDAAQDGIDAALGELEQPPQEWMEGKPLYRALGQRIQQIERGKRA